MDFRQDELALLVGRQNQCCHNNLSCSIIKAQSDGDLFAVFDKELDKPQRVCLVALPPIQAFFFSV